MSAILDLNGKRFGRLVVIGRAEDRVQKNGRRRVMWTCQCDCGNVVTVLGDNLKKGVSNSCGCLRKEIMSAAKSTHGDTKTKLYGVWCGIKRRCYNEHTMYYEKYGGRGITMCDEWRDSYEAFKKWAESSGYSEGLSIERVDNDGPYSPENCEWADSKTQANNRHSNVKLTLNGETHNITQWSSIVGISAKKLFNRYYAGKSVENILKK